MWLPTSLLYTKIIITLTSFLLLTSLTLPLYMVNAQEFCPGMGILYQAIILAGQGTSHMYTCMFEAIQ